MASGRHGRPRNELDGPEEVIETLCKMAAAIREQATVVHHIMKRMEQRNEEISEGHNGGADVDLKCLKFAEFRKANPPSFIRAYNLDRANE